MSTSPDAGPAGAPADTVRPLPPRPSLEYERKEAKTLVRPARRGDPDAHSRVRAQWRGDDSRDLTELRLADAQVTIAREYGFTSWPKLVSYFESLERHERSSRSINPPHVYEGQVRSLLAQHRDRRPAAGAWLATFVPRFYGSRVDDVLASPLTIEDARLTVARQAMCPSWDVLIERARSTHARAPREWERQRNSHRHAFSAIKASDLAALSAAVTEHPKILGSTTPETAAQSLVHSALITEMRSRSPAARGVTDWLASRGEDLGAALHRMLCGHYHMETRDVEFLLARGADPNWIAPNGIPVLEYALVRYWNPEAADLVAHRAVPRTAFWISAALGDVDAVARAVKRDGTVTDAARRDRPDFTAIGPAVLPCVPDAPDVEILWEAFFVAATNRRAAVMDLLLERGFPIDYMGWEMSMLSFAVGNRLTSLVGMLLRRGASLDVRGRHPDMTPRELARWNYQNDPTNADARRILKLCDGGDPKVLLQAYETERANIRPSPSEGLRNQIALAAEEARRLGQDAVEPDNLFVAMFNSRSSFALGILERADVNIDGLLAALGDRLLSSDGAVESPPSPLPLSAATRDVMERAAGEVLSMRSTTMTAAHVLVALVESNSLLIAASLAAGGITPARVRQAAAEMGLVG